MNKFDHPKNPNVSLHWPVPILTKKLESYEQVNAGLIELFATHRKSHGADDGKSYASADDLQKHYKEHPQFAALTRFISDSVYEITSTLNGEAWKELKVQDLSINISGIWFQITNEYNFHEVHVHGNCSWSGVYYVQSGDSANQANNKSLGFPNGVTRFYGPHLDYQGAGHLDLGNMYVQDASFDSVPEDGKLVIFPSYLKHMPYPYIGDKDRIVVSFHAQVNSPKPVRLGYSFN